jgi:polysaccharide export outer membrane protein
MTRFMRSLAGVSFIVVLGVMPAVGHAQQRTSGSTASSPRLGGASTAGAAAAAAPEYRIGPEDVLDVVVWQDVDLTARGVQVRPDGRISLPVINDVLAAGLTPMELRAAIIKGLEGPYHDKEVSVTVREVNSMRISVVGKVRTPSRVQLRSAVTIVDAIAAAGGFADFAQSDKICVLRRDGTRLMFNYDKFVKDPSAKDNFLLQAGDQVIVP